MEVVLGGLVGGLGGIPVEALHKVCLEVQGDPGVLGNLPGHLALVQDKAASTSCLKTRKSELLYLSLYQRRRLCAAGGRIGVSLGSFQDWSSYSTAENTTLDIARIFSETSQPGIFSAENLHPRKCTIDLDQVV